MTKDEALKMALEALEIEHSPIYGTSQTAKAIKFIKEVLAQPEQIDLVREMRNVQGQHGNWNYDPYMQGLYNGLEFAVSLLEKREPQFKDAPETWIGDIKVKRDRFNNTEPMTAAHGIKENT